MRVDTLRMQNFRAFEDSGTIELTSLNVFIGANNAGKSSVLRAVHQLQHGLPDVFGDVRVGSAEAIVEMQLSGVSGTEGFPSDRRMSSCFYTSSIRSNDRRSGNLNIHLRNKDGSADLGRSDFRLPSVEPHHAVVPYFSKRKTASYGEDVREEFVMSVTSNVSNLAAKLSRLANPAFPGHKEYADACMSILGFLVTAIPSQNGQRPGIYLPDKRTVPIEQMGEGVPNIVQLLASLAISEGKIFLIEEPENDLHPAAVKTLMQLILRSSEKNQFFVSTHSNIVVRYLCGEQDSRLFKLSSEFGVLPTTTTIEVVPNASDARQLVLRELGYEFSDLELWDGWLLLEESSAERIIRDFLIPWFCPDLVGVRTISAGGVDSVEPMFADFSRLAVFIHLQAAYANRTWVRVDAGPQGDHVVSRLRAKFSSWSADRFATFEHENFEHFYPNEFKSDVQVALSIVDRQRRRQAKRELLIRVVEWLRQDKHRGMAALAESAGSLIADLKAMEKAMAPARA